VIHLDDELVSFFPDFRLQNRFATKRGITFRQLATHLAGLPRESPCANFNNCSMDNKLAFARLQKLEYISPSDTLPVYSNLGFALLGNMIAAIQQVAYEDLIKTEVITPLGLKSTGVIMSKAPLNQLALPYYSDGTPCDPTDCLADFGWANPEGSIYSTAQDLSSLMSFFFRDRDPANPANGQILDGATIREMMRPSWINGDRASGFAMPFEMTQLGKFLLRLKRGDVDGYASEIVMVPEMKLGLVVLTNIVEHAPPYAQAITKILVPAFENLLSSLAPSPALPPNWNDYVGQYTAQGQVISVSSNGAYLLIQGAGFDMSLVWISGNKFQIRPTPGDMRVCLDIQTDGDYNVVNFVTNANKVTGLTFDGLSFDQVFVKK